MSFLSTNELRNLLPTWIDPFKPERVKNAQYELSLGSQVYLTNSESGTKDILDDKKSQIVIEPGQFGILLTEEIVTVPRTKIGFISIKFKQKKKGLVNVSGFHVDPGFSGRIKFSVYNAGPAKIILDRGQACFLIWFSELSSEAEEYKGEHQKQLEIISDDIEPLKGELASPNVILERMQKIEAKQENLDWLRKIIIGLLVAVALKLLWEWNQFKNGYEKGLREKAAIDEVKSAVNKSLIDTLVLKKVDSIIQTKNFVIDTTGKKGEFRYEKQ